MDNGGTTQQALKLGLAAGVAEVLFEKVSVENLLKPRTPQGWRDVVNQYVVQQGLVELSEEACTEIANILAEVSILGADSDYAKAVEGYRDQGASESEAKQKAFLDMLGRVGWSGAGGFISGAGMGGGKAAVDYASQSGAQSLSNAGKALIETIQGIGADQQKTASTGEAGINPGNRKTVREIVGDMPSADYDVPHVAIPADVLVDEDGSQISISKIPSAIRRYMIKLFRGKVLNIGADNKVYISRDGIKEYSFPVKRMDEDTKLAKMAAGAHLDTTLGPAVFLLNTTDDGRHPKATGGWDNFYVMFEAGTGLYSGIVKTMRTDRGREFYDITEIQKEGDPTTHGDNGLTPPPARTETPSEIRIPQIQPDVKPEGDGGVDRRAIDASADTAATAALTTLLQKVKSTAEGMVERPEGLPESILKQFQPLWEKQLTAAKCKALGDLLGFTPELQKTIEPLLDKLLADAEDIARWESLDRSTQVWQHLQPMYQEKKASIQWLENILQKMEGRNGEQKQAAESDVGQESELENKARHVAKGILSMGRPTGFEGLPQNLRHSFNEGLKTASPEIQVALRQWKRKVQYITSVGKRSIYRPEKQVVSIGRNGTPSTVAHELFHWADEGRRISSQLLEPLMQDYIALKMASGEDVKAYLMERYPGAFIADDVLQDSFTMRPEFRGIADILNGLSGGKERYGYGHSKQYWAKEGALEAEAWAQFGRHQYDNLNVVLKMFQELFPNFYESAMIKLKELM